MIDAAGFFAKLRVIRMTRQTRNWLMAPSILAFPFILFFGCLIYMEEPLPPLAPLPNPNGYDDLAKAGQMIKGIVSDYDKASLEQLRGIVSTNAEALSLARTALSNQCAVPLQFSRAFGTSHLPVLIGFRSLAQAIACEGKFAEKENRFNDAAKSCLDEIHFGNEAARGGILVDEMIGIAIGSIGAGHLQTIATNLDAKTCRETAATLETLASQTQTWDETMQRENDWSRRSFSGLKGRTIRLYYQLAYSRMREQNHQHAIDTINSTRKKESQLLIALAARAYELDKGHPPATAADLVPEYLKTVPQDPVTGTNMACPP
jgi:hypothetical protein